MVFSSGKDCTPVGQRRGIQRPERRFIATISGAGGIRETAAFQPNDNLSSCWRVWKQKLELEGSGLIDH
jgi:hypothetical protein